MSARRFFGTDGIRGVAGSFPMTARLALALGAALAEHLAEAGGPRPTVLVGRDTRHSGPMLAAAVAAGLAARGADVVDVGVLPTPGVSHLVGALGARAGVMVSASHNPFDDNGLKVFGPDGAKLADEAEVALESRLEAHLGGDDAVSGRTGTDLGAITVAPEAADAYVRFLLGHAPYLDGLRVGLDCAHGAAHEVAPRVFQRIGARLDVLHARPDGRNINDRCGSTHPEAIAARVAAAGLDVGITFDGDADRALLVDRRGRLVTGDHVLAICAVTRGDRTVVATHMTNLGTERYLADRGIALERVAVGDRYVLEGLRARGLQLGGEQSGHVLFLDKAPTGDGILTALQVLAACRSSGKALEAWVDEIPVFPQRLVNVRVTAGAATALVTAPAVVRAADAAREALGGGGRLLLRPSGTEPLVRVMVEAERQDDVDRWCGAVAEAVRDAAATVGCGRPAGALAGASPP